MSVELYSALFPDNRTFTYPRRQPPFTLALPPEKDLPSFPGGRTKGITERSKEMFRIIGHAFWSLIRWFFIAVVAVGIKWAAGHVRWAFVVASVINVFVGIAANFMPATHFASAIAFFVAGIEVIIVVAILLILFVWDDLIDGHFDWSVLIFALFVALAISVFVEYRYLYPDMIVSLNDLFHP